VESPNSCAGFEINLDEIPSTSSFDIILPHLPTTKVNPFHVIFDMNEVLITTHFDKGSHTIIFSSWIERIIGKMPCSILGVYLVCSPTSQYL